LVPGSFETTRHQHCQAGIGEQLEPNSIRSEHGLNFRLALPFSELNAIIKR
jgi:hypothetical protein